MRIPEIFHFGDAPATPNQIDRESFMVRLLNRLLPHKNIVNCDKDIYLRRWYLFRSKRLGIFIHKFERSDEDRALHDHPWPFIVIPIWRGYIEHSMRPCDCWHCTCSNPSGPSIHPWHEAITRVYPIIGARLRQATYRHRVELLRRTGVEVRPISERKDIDPSRAEMMGVKQYLKAVTQELSSWSLFIRFREFRTWGFWLPDGFKAWNLWWKENCE